MTKEILEERAWKLLDAYNDLIEVLEVQIGWDYDGLIIEPTDEKLAEEINIPLSYINSVGYVLDK